MSTLDETESIITNEEKPISTVTHTRRVHFPSDESQLRIISIAPEPLANQPLVSLGVTLQRYRAACQRLQIRPLMCLLDQLGTIDDQRKSFQDRLESLRIVNERLDLKQIDAIEEIFSRCRFQTLDFDSSFTDDLILVQFFDVIEYYESCTHLNLSNNRSIGIQGYQALTRYLRKTRVLERLDMNSIRFDETSMLGFGRALRLSSTLYELHVESCQLNGKILQKFIQNLRACVCLRELYLCDNRIQVQDSLLINDLIRSSGQFLHVLDLRSNFLQDNGLSHLASQLSQYDENHTQQNSIWKINFQSNQITQQGIAFLAKSLLHNRTIRSLNLSHNPMTNEGFFLLRDALLTNRTINELILRNCRLTDQAAIALAEYIAESSTIRYVDLRENPIQASGICGIAIAMKTNQSIFKLEIDSICSSTINSSNQPQTDRTAPMGSFLSLANLRRMTVGLGSLTSGTANQINGENEQMTQELLEQKAKWINDIECLCERNLLLHQEEQKLKNDENSLINGLDQQESSIRTPDEIHLEDNLISTMNEHSQSTDPSETNGNTIEPSLDTPVDHSEQLRDTSTHDSHSIEASLTNTIEPLSNGENHMDLPSTRIDENPNLSSISNEDDENHVDHHKRKLHHSDSLYLLRKKVQNEDDNTSDDQSPTSSTNEPIIDGV